MVDVPQFCHESRICVKYGLMQKDKGQNQRIQGERENNIANNKLGLGCAELCSS
jgi:hypothetical protein